MQADAADLSDYPSIEPTAFIVAGQHSGVLAGEATACGRVRSQPRVEHHPEHHESAADGQNRQPRALSRQELAEDHDERCGGKAENRYEPGPLHQIATRTLTVIFAM